MSKSSKAVIGAAKDPWKYIHRCLVCGSKLRFKRMNTGEHIPRENGIKYCEHNHDRFTVLATYGTDNQWTITYMLPGKE